MQDLILDSYVKRPFAIDFSKSTCHPVATCKPGLNVPEGEHGIVRETDIRISSPLPFIRLCQLPRLSLFQKLGLS
ncbi:hypothetical protein AV530_007438 [Patagioenas fasciata monilis]|uniref:Uncharacterized protein n=1 Tax=Patagioenas fasciata monilis TaxID=372326 RepID=A0A1V4JZD3_PATFA|nr:hypothetical protein AV530_007438 [Patagioenas fasciata monilis]